MIARSCRFLSRVVLLILLFGGLGIGALYAFQRDLIYPGEGNGAHIWNRPPVGMEVVTLETTDGLALNAFYRAPRGSADTIVFFHGNGGNARMAADIMSAVAGPERGLLLVEYRGYAGNPGEPTEQGLYHDGRAGLAFLDGEGIAADQIVIGGFSLGSGVASKMAAEVTPAGLFLLSPFTSLDDVAAERFSLPPLSILVHDKFATDERLAAIDAPLFIAHGGRDRVVPPDHGRELYEARPDATWVWLENAGHGTPWDGELQQRLSAWVDAL